MRVEREGAGDAAAERVLRGVERLGGELKRGAPVVVQPSDQLRRHLGLDPQCVEAGQHPFEVGDRRQAEEAGQLRRTGDDRLVLTSLRVEHPQRVALKRRRRLLGQVAQVIGQIGRQRVDVGGPLGGLAQRVDQQPQPTEPQAAKEAPGQRNRLGVQVRVLGAQGFQPHLVELPVAALLGLLVAKLRPGVPHLPGQHRRPVLGEGPAHRRCQLGSQRHRPSALVGELVHLLGDDVGRRAHPGEHTQILEHRRGQVAVPGQLGRISEALHQRPAPLGFGAEHVPGADRCGETFRAGGSGRLSRLGWLIGRRIGLGHGDRS